MNTSTPSSASKVVSVSNRRRIITARQLFRELNTELSMPEVYRLLGMLRRLGLARKIGFDTEQKKGQPAHIWSIPTWVKLDLCPVESKAKPARKPRKKTASAVPPPLP